MQQGNEATRRNKAMKGNKVMRHRHAQQGGEVAGQGSRTTS